MELKEIYQPIAKELSGVERLLRTSLVSSSSRAVLEIGNYLLDTKGKRLRPALVILSTQATLKQEPKSISEHLIKIAAAIELIHMASLIHDDVIDHASVRHNQATINRKFGQDASIALGDYLYSIGFALISSCRAADILSCIASATKEMCAGELLQVCERDNLNLLKQRYIIIARKKTASLFIASCQAGTLLSRSPLPAQQALKTYGLNFGLAFQIIDDCLDLTGEARDLGKAPGADFKMGELTLPVLNLLAEGQDRKSILSLIRKHSHPQAFGELKRRFVNSRALLKTKEDACFYVQEAKKGLGRLEDSCFKQSLFDLADYITQRLR